MRFVAPATFNHRLQRLHRWAMLWLTGFAAFLQAAAEFAPLSPAAQSIAHQWLDCAEALIVRIVIARGAPQIRITNRRRGLAQHELIRRSLIRALVGARMRRSFRVRDLQARIAALRQSIDALVAQFVKRLPRGLTRRRPISLRSSNWSASALAGICPNGLSHAVGLLADTS